MKEQTKKLLVKYLICVGVACLITFVVVWISGFFTNELEHNLRVLADGFFVSGALISMFAGMMFISSQGALIGIGFVLRNVLLGWFIPMGRKRQEKYADYRERKMSELKKPVDAPILVTGLAFLVTGIVLTMIWYVKFYNITG